MTVKKPMKKDLKTHNKNQYDLLFNTQNINKKVKQKSVKAGVTNLTSQALSLTITLFRAAILARLLSPDDYGVFTMVIVIIGFALIFKDLGLSTATIREKEITHEQVSNLFWINTVIGIFSMIIVIALAPGIVWFYGDSRLASIAFVLSIAFLFGGLAVQHQALLKRQMQFGKIAFITLSADLFSSLIGIIIAWLQYGYWALIWMNVARSFFLMIGFWYFTEWKPGLWSKHTGTKKFLKLGVDVAGLNAFSTITRNLDKIIAGKIASASSLGFYIKGNQVPNLISGQIRMAFFSVALPALSSLQKEKERFFKYYYDFLNVICWITMPFAVLLFVFAEEIIQIYFGPKWGGSAIFMKIFAIHSLIMPAVTTLDQIPLSLGQSKRYLFAGIVRSIGTIFCVAIGGILYGIIGIATGVAIANIVTFIPFCKLCIKDNSITIKKYFKTLSIPLFTSITIGGIFYLYKPHFLKEGVFFDLLYMFAYLILVIIFLLAFDFLRIGHHLGIVEFLFKRRTKIR